MIRVLACSVLLVCAGCAGASRAQRDVSPCANNPGGYECQIERYQRAPG
jgi:hypothetical protein